MLIKIDNITVINTQQLVRIYVRNTGGSGGTVAYKALKELLEYKETGLTPQDIKNMDKMYLEKCQEVNSLVAACEKLEGRKQYESK